MNHKSLSRKYIIVAACCAIQAIGVGAFVTYGVFFSSLVEELQWSRAVISGGSSLALFLSGLFAILVGKLNDRYGPRLLMSGCALLYGIGFMLMSQVMTIWQLYLYYGVIFGLGLSGVDVIALTTTARWFQHNRGVMTGIVKVGTGAGQFSVPALAGLLIVGVGWRQAYVIIGGSAMLLLLLVAQFLQRDPETARIPNSDNSSFGLETKTPRNIGLTTGQAFRTPQLWLLCGMNFLLVFSLLIILVHIVPHAADLGVTTTKAASVLSMIGAVSMAGRFICGVSIDRIGSKSVMLGCLLVLLVGLTWLQFAHSLIGLYLFATVYGLAHGGIFTAISPLVAEVFGLGSHGALLGIVIFSGTTGGAIGPVIAGHVFDITGSYDLIFLTLCILSLVALFLLVALRPASLQQELYNARSAA